MEQLINLKMVKVEGGTFEMSRNDANTFHSVIVNDFYIGMYQITQKQWHEIMGNNPSFSKGSDEFPVINVGWDDIQKFIKNLNQNTNKDYRLPTNTEWEYAARGGNKSKGYKYAGSDEFDKVGWNKENSVKNINPVGGKMPNELGLYDMSGNVWELCNDWYNNERPTTYNRIENSYIYDKVMRGGCWNSPLFECPIVYHKYIPFAEICSHNIGFRVAITYI